MTFGDVIQEEQHPSEAGMKGKPNISQIRDSPQREETQLQIIKSVDSENEESPDTIRNEAPQPLEFVLGKTEQDFKITNMTHLSTGMKVHPHLIKVKNLRLQA